VYLTKRYDAMNLPNAGRCARPEGFGMSLGGSPSAGTLRRSSADAKHDSVVLGRDLPKYGLKAGDVGTVVLVHPAGGYEVEFITLDGKTVAVTSLSIDEVQPIGRREISHAREIETA